MQINRLFEIVYILLEKEKVTARELAERFEVSTRTVYRDIEALSCAGIPVYMSKGKGGGVSLLPGFTLNKAVITEGEKAEISFPKGEWLFYYLLGFGQAVEVLEPVEVREQLKGELEKYLD